VVPDDLSQNCLFSEIAESQSGQRLLNDWMFVVSMISCHEHTQGGMTPRVICQMEKIANFINHAIRRFGRLEVNFLRFQGLRFIIVLVMIGAALFYFDLMGLFYRGL
jgi:hypothetical protein